MTVIGVFLVALLGFGLIYFTFRIWGLLFVRRTNDLKTLHKYQALPIWGPIATRKLEAIYSKQLAECTSSKEARKIKDIAWKYDLSRLQLPAYQKVDNLTFDEKINALSEAVHDEAKLLKFIDEIGQLPCSGDDELYSSAMEALRPFTEKRIHDTTTVRELLSLREEKELLDFCFWKEGLDRIDDILKGIYERKLKQLVLREALDTCRNDEMSNPCFQCKTDDHVINGLVAMKRNLLALCPQCNSFWTSGPLHGEIDFALERFLEHHSSLPQ